MAKNNKIKSSDLTVCVPVYNGKKLIKKCLNSILKQNIKNIKIVIYDNCSNDGTYKICKQYKKKYRNIKLFKQKKFVSWGDNWMSAINKVKTKYVTFCGHDDFYKKKNHLENLCKNLSFDTIPYPLSITITENGKTIDKLKKIFFSSNISFFRKIKYVFTLSYFYDKTSIMFGIHETNFFRKIYLSILNNKYVNNNNLYLFRDRYMYFQFLNKKKAICIKSAIIYKTIRTKEITRSFFGKGNFYNNLKQRFKMLFGYVIFGNLLEKIIISLLLPFYIILEKTFYIIFVLPKTKKHNN